MEEKLQEMKVVVFRVGSAEFGLHVDDVISIERMQPITAIPKTSEHVAGVINLRGVVVPVVDLRKALLQRAAEDNESTRIIVVSIEEKPVGLVVDAATDVLDIPSDSIQTTDLAGDHSAPFLLGVAKLNDSLLILIDINKLLQNITFIEKLKKLGKINEVYSSDEENRVCS